MTVRKSKTEKTETAELLKIINENENDKKIEKLQKSNEELSQQLHTLKGVVSVVGLIFGAISIVFLVFNFQFQEFKRSEQYSQEPLVFLFDDKIANTIDEISFIDPDDAQHEQRRQELLNLRDKINMPVFKNEKFTSRNDLVNSIELILSNKDEEAGEKIDEIIKKYSSTDPFVASRAYTLKAFNEIRKHNRECRPEAMQAVETAIEKDRRAGAAYSLLGLCLRDQARNELESNKSNDPNVKTRIFNEAAAKMQKALNYYDFAFYINPTNWTRCRAVNNKIYGNSVFLEKIVNDEQFYNDYLKLSRYEGIDDFFNDSLRNLEFCMQLNPKHFILWESQAELYGLKILYGANKNITSKEKSDLIQEMKTAYLEAINLGLFKKKTPANAINSFEKNTLLAEIRNDSEVRMRIEEKSKQSATTPTKSQTP